MTSRGHGIIFQHARGFSATCLALASAALIVGCASATIEDAVPQSASSLPAAGPVDTGTYPNLNIEPVAAAAQLTPAQRTAKEAELTAARARLAGRGGSAPSSDTQPLKRLAQSHGEEVLTEIEAGQ